ncbi:P-loop containing nucleoside triphosphate hydrolase protein [Haematococcus lacustris]
MGSRIPTPTSKIPTSNFSLGTPEPRLAITDDGMSTPQPASRPLTQPATPYLTPMSVTRNPLTDQSERVKVVVRVRPCLRASEHPGSLDLQEARNGKLTLTRPDAIVPFNTYQFDKVLDADTTQQDVYHEVRDVVEDVLHGYNGTILAYGQTGAGKTHSLMNIEPQAIGVIPRCVAEIFKKAAADPFHAYAVSMSYIQIYMELIQDLLHPESDNLHIREDATNGVFVAGAHEVPVTTLEECLHYLELGERNRSFAFTHLNAHSSRSHAVVMVTVVKSQRYVTPQDKASVKRGEKDSSVLSQKVKVGKLYLVDLAGSERLKKSRSVGLRASEAKSINLSLTALGMCISARANDERHIPFRDSKLTRLLQESLGGNAKTTLLVCVADVREHADESLQSLQFGSRAMFVKNKPVVNERVDFRTLHSELLVQMDSQRDRASELEVAVLRTEEERDALHVSFGCMRAVCQL